MIIKGLWGDIMAEERLPRMEAYKLLCSVIGGPVEMQESAIPGRWGVSIGSLLLEVSVDHRMHTGRLLLLVKMPGVAGEIARLYDRKTMLPDLIAEKLYGTWSEVNALQDWISDNGPDYCHDQIDYYS